MPPLRAGILAYFRPRAASDAATTSPEAGQAGGRSPSKSPPSMGTSLVPAGAGKSRSATAYAPSLSGPSPHAAKAPGISLTERTRIHTRHRDRIVFMPTA